ncbi:c-type cytochrome [Hymenobacter sp. 5317J-9]|uniref:c-type cytochrome n=1 Tax=Hymenobacter sp. 5317J-9 TaxID=2932250 RepID=UPI001FD64F92|nr:cytochrome c [Hymenobacter sp. 5317J-9]UOQ96169.1 c-type cytochrome [Hymenobacter sp. 5317J-9]
MKKLFVMLSLLALSAGPAAAQKKPPVKAPAKKAVGVPAAVLAQGKSVYVQNCLSCHQADGLGVDGLNPPLAKTDYVLGDKTRLTKVLLNGLQGVDINGEPYNNVMPAQESLTDAQIAAVLTYVRNSFGNKASAVSATEVKAIRANNKK